MSERQTACGSVLTLMLGAALVASGIMRLILALRMKQDTPWGYHRIMDDSRHDLKRKAPCDWRGMDRFWAHMDPQWAHRAGATLSRSPRPLAHPATRCRLLGFALQCCHDLGVAPPTALVRLIRCELERAQARDRGLERSPCDRLKPKMVIGKKAVRTRVLKDDELRLMWNAADAMGYPYGPLFRLLALTGQRKSEVAEARWSEFDLEGSPGCSTSGKVFDSNAGPLLRNGLLRPLPVYHGFSTATLEDRLVAMFRDHLWPDDLDRLYGAIEGERDVLAGDVFEAANEAIVRGMMTHVKMQRQLTQNRRSQIISRPLNGLPREQAFPWRS